MIAASSPSQIRRGHKPTSITAVTRGKLASSVADDSTFILLHHFRPSILPAPNCFVVVTGMAWIGRSRSSIARVAYRCNTSARWEPNATICTARDNASARLLTACIALRPRPLSPTRRPPTATTITAHPSLPFALAVTSATSAMSAWA
ncbi:hypothetical protein ACLOJK_022721, partial [Asimina triloba]